MPSRPKVDSQKIAQLRRLKKIDQTEFAGRLRKHGLGATQATVSRWENGQEPRAYALPAIAAELGVTVDELYGDEDDEESDQLPHAPDDMLAALAVALERFHPNYRKAVA